MMIGAAMAANPDLGIGVKMAALQNHHFNVFDVFQVEPKTLGKASERGLD